jgi:lipoprotein-anchoring transpeptidase ErfK/SrfK
MSALMMGAFLAAGETAPAFAQQTNSAGGGGGFIEMIFAGVAREPTVPQPYQPEPEYPTYPQANMSAPPQPGYQTASAETASQTMVAPQPANQVATAAPTNSQSQVNDQAAPQAPAANQLPVSRQASRQRQTRQQAPRTSQQVAYQDASVPQPRRQAARDSDYVNIIPMPSVGYEPLPPVKEDPPVASAPAFAPSSDGDMEHPLVDPKFNPQVVEYSSPEKPGTVIIDTPHHFLYLVQEEGKAMRYGIGVGKPGFTWHGVKTVTAKKEWPDWYPPPEMIQRRPDLPRYMAGGPENPLGARAMYLGSTLYRIHGSNEPWTIGGDVSSGCIRLRNADVIDLYGRVQVGAKVVVM